MHRPRAGLSGIDFTQLGHQKYLALNKKLKFFNSLSVFYLVPKVSIAHDPALNIY